VQAGDALARRGGGIDLEAADFKHRLHGKQDSNFIVDEQNAAFHAFSFSVTAVGWLKARRTDAALTTIHCACAEEVRCRFAG